MGGSLGPLGKTVVWGSALLFVYVTLYVIVTVGISGFVLGSLLYFLWACILKATAFVSVNDGVIIHVSDITDEDRGESADDQLPVSLPEDPRVLGGTGPARDVGAAVSRIIGADARGRVVRAQSTAHRDNLPRPPNEPSAGDSDFADFLRSKPF